MNTLVNRQALLEKLTANRQNHRTVYEQAFDAYSGRLVSEIEGFLKQAKARKSTRVYSTLPIPEDHTEAYDSVIALLEMSTEETIELDDEDARRYVLDRWEWERSFASNTTAYLSK